METMISMPDYVSIALRLAPNAAQRLISLLSLANLTSKEVAMVGGGEDLTPAEVAAELKTSSSTVRRWERTGILVPRRLPSGHRRYRREDVEKLRERVESGEFIWRTEKPPTKPAEGDG
jgi:DNA-binding transcriptional regulator YiaG